MRVASTDCRGCRRANIVMIRHSLCNIVSAGFSNLLMKVRAVPSVHVSGRIGQVALFFPAPFQHWVSRKLNGTIWEDGPVRPVTGTHELQSDASRICNEPLCQKSSSRAKKNNLKQETLDFFSVFANMSHRFVALSSLENFRGCPRVRGLSPGGPGLEGNLAKFLVGPSST